MKIAIIGGFGYKKTNGQTVKTNNLCNLLADNELFKVDTANWKSHPFSLLLNIKKAFELCDIIIMLPAQRGVKVFSKLLVHFNKKYKKKIFYDVIGGWLSNYLLENKKVLNDLSAFSGIWVEIPTMQKKLNELGLNKVEVVPNFKDIPIIEEYCGFSNIFKTCVFSRITYSKGVEDAISAVFSLSKSGIRIKLDIYGPIEKKYKEKFDKILKENDSTFINYKGIVDASKSTEIISKYNALLFPTFYEGEGFAGTLIDAMFSGVPVIASDWRYNCDIIKDKYNGLIFKTRDIDDLNSKIMTLINNPELCNVIHKNCLIESSKYTKKSALSLINKLLNK